MGIFHSSFYLHNPGFESDDSKLDEKQKRQKKAYVSFLNALPLENYISQCPRFRSIEIDTVQPFVAVRGRCGGGNRPDFVEQIENMQSFDSYVTSFDCDSDNTYMYFVYELPQEDYEAWKKLTTEYSDIVEHVDHQGHPCDCRDFKSSRYALWLNQLIKPTVTTTTITTNDHSASTVVATTAVATAAGKTTNTSSCIMASVSTTPIQSAIPEAITSVTGSRHQHNRRRGRRRRGKRRGQGASLVTTAASSVTRPDFSSSMSTATPPSATPHSLS